MQGQFPDAVSTLHGQGKTSEAHDALARVEQARIEWIKTMHDGLVGTLPFGWADSWVDWLECEIHFRHAKTQIDGAPPVEDPRLAAIQERALATITYGDVFTYMDLGRQQVSRREWREAAINLKTCVSGMSAVARSPVLANGSRQVPIMKSHLNYSLRNYRNWTQRTDPVR